MAFCKEKSYLESSVAELEEDNMLHTQVLLDEVHPARTVNVLPSEGIVTIQAVKNVALEVLQEVYLAFELRRILFDLEALH